MKQIFVGLLILCSLSAQAEICKSKDAQGMITYQECTKAEAGQSQRVPIYNTDRGVGAVEAKAEYERTHMSYLELVRDREAREDRDRQQAVAREDKREAAKQAKEVAQAQAVAASAKAKEEAKAKSKTVYIRAPTPHCFNANGPGAPINIVCS